METNLRTTTILRPDAKQASVPQEVDCGHNLRLDGPRVLQSAPVRREIFDKLVAALMLIPALPVILIVYSLVKLTSRGPGFYSQRRVGREGRVFHIHKVRTMSWNCESGTGAIWAAKGDPRVTWIGGFLRATHLDELPQLFNVLDGDMAMVGPRPERPEIIERLLPEIPGYLDRLAVLPGVTGLAQVCTGADQSIDDVRRKLEFDRVYIPRKSAWLDVRIMLCTVLKVLHLNFRWVRRLMLPESRLVTDVSGVPYGAVRTLDAPAVEPRPAERLTSDSA
jgi:lipopolysaccharide/colanic/teichoic acid biosynthesis glycosyltransferase